MQGKISLSLCMIVKDEEETLERCLSCVKTFVDEIIIVDTGSKDKTKEIAKSFNAKIYDFQWINDFSAARNYAFSKATGEYAFWLDADDFITDENIEKLNKLVYTLDRSIDSVTMNYSLLRDENNKTIYSLRRNRIVKRANNFAWIGRIHEFLDVKGNILNSDITIHHGKVKEITDRNLQMFRGMEREGVKFSLRDVFYYGNELYYNKLYYEAILKYEEFINSKEGWIEDVKTATSNLIDCYTFTGEVEKKLNVILSTFKVDIPRADICCKLGEYFLENQKFKQAIFWYKVALGCIPESNNLGIDRKEYYTWIPSIQLCVCYSKLGDYDSAYYYNEITALYTPSSSKVEHNRKFLKAKFKELGREEPNLDIMLIPKSLRTL